MRMHGNQILTVALMLVMMFPSSCAYENEEELFGENVCIPEDATYSLAIQPIIATNCALPGCHNGSNQSIPDWTVLANVQAKAALIKERTGNRTMPPSNSGAILLKQEIDEIACWVDNGAQNN